MDNLQKLIIFLNKLEEQKIFYRLSKVRDSILVEIAVPGERWEVEYMFNGTIEIEKFNSSEFTFDESELDILFRDFSD